MKRNYRGMTFGELMIVIAIIAILVLTAILAWQHQINRGYDARRKADIAKLKRSFEEYYNDHDCYPTQEEWDAFGCIGTGTEFLSTYLGGSIPCDPQTQQKYAYMTILHGGKDCGSYQMATMISDWQDVDVLAHECGDPAQGCGIATLTPAYNYAVTQSGWVVGPGNPTTPTSAPGTTSTPPTVTPTPSDLWAGKIACCSNYICCDKGSIEQAQADGCGQSFATWADCGVSGCPQEIWCD